MKLRDETRVRRFWARVDQSGSCWLWTGKRLRSGGYGTVRWHGVEERAHRVSYALANGPVPEGAHVLHRCDNPPCVRPAHLFLGDHTENMADMAAKGRAANAAIRNPPTRCPQGHDYATNGYRSGAAQKLACRSCVNARSRAYQAARRATAALAAGSGR